MLKHQIGAILKIALKQSMLFRRIVMGGKICSFFGHRTIKYENFIRLELFRIIENLITEEGYDTFIFGGFSEFDKLCHQIVTELKRKYHFVRRVFCLIEEKHMTKKPSFLVDEEYEGFAYYTLKFDYWYTRIYYRNCEIIKNSDFIIFYAEERQNSGAFKALKFAIKNKSNFINLYR